MSNQPTVARSNAPIAVSDAADIPDSLAEAGKALQNASSTTSRMTRNLARFGGVIACS
jgi:hypothetical protein